MFAQNFFEESKNKYRKKPRVLIVEQHGKNWSIPKGKPKGDETCVETAVRELYEETNVKLSDYTLFGDYETAPGWQYMSKAKKHYGDALPLMCKSKRKSLGGKEVMKVIHMFGGILHTSLKELPPFEDKAITDIDLATYGQSKKKLHKKDFEAVWKLYRTGLWQYVSNER